MKKILPIILALLVLTISSVAIAEFDVTSMSDEQLETIIQHAQAELSKRKAVENEVAMEADGPVTIKEAGFGIVSNYLFYSFVAHSNYTDKAIRFPEFRIVVRDEAGDLVGTDNYTWDYLLPGQDIYCVSQGPNVEGENPSYIEIEFIEPKDYYIIGLEKVDNADALVPVVESAKLKIGSGFSHVVGELSNPNAYTIDKARVVVMFRDGDGNLVGGGSTTVDSIKTGKKTAFDVSVYSALVTDNYDVYVMIDR